MRPALQKSALRKVHPPLGQIRKGRHSSSRLEVGGKRCTRHRRRLCELSKLPGAAGITMHKLECRRETPVAQGAKPSGRLESSGFEVRSQYLDEHQMCEL